MMPCSRNEESTAPPIHRSGLVAIIGRANVGKSTLLNRLLGQKIAIVTPKPQTTQRRILGIKTLPGVQILFVDTPGMHRARGLINVRMVERAQQAMAEADVVVWLVDSREGVRSGDRAIAASLRSREGAVVVALNKIDSVPKPQLLPIMERLASELPGQAAIPISAVTGENLDTLLEAVVDELPEGPLYYPGEEVTSETEREIVAEIIREKVMLETQEEIPYSVAVTVDAFEEARERNVTVVRATVHVSRRSQKPIVIGRGGPG